MLFFTSRDKAVRIAKDMTVKRLCDIYDVFKDMLTDVSKNVGIAAMITDAGAKIRMI